jgi:putative transposase
MPYWRLFYHIMWAVKDRQPLIRTEMESLLYSALIAKGRSLGAIIYAVNGIEDHVHIAASIPPSIALAEWVGQIKGGSSRALNLEFPDDPLIWQRGYGIVSFGQKNLDVVVGYIQRQKEHHALNTVMPFLETDDPDVSLSYPPGWN